MLKYYYLIIVCHNFLPLLLSFYFYSEAKELVLWNSSHEYMDLLSYNGQICAFLCSSFISISSLWLKSTWSINPLYIYYSTLPHYFLSRMGWIDILPLQKNGFRGTVPAMLINEEQEFFMSLKSQFSPGTLSIWQPTLFIDKWHYWPGS